MKALLLKDAKAAGWLVAATIALFALASVTASRVDEALFWLTVALAVGLWVMPPLVDWQVDADRFLCSLPVDRTTVVRARAAWMLLAAAVAMLLWIASGSAWQSVVWADAGAPTTPMWMTFEGLVAFAMAAVVLGVVFLPCYFRFGLGKGIAVFGILSFVILAGAVGLSMAGGEPAAPSAGQAVAGGSMPAAGIQHAVGRLRGGLGAPGTVALLGGLGTLAAWMSLRLAARFYENREF